MKNLKTILTASALATTTVLSSCGGGTLQTPDAKFSNSIDSASYAIGILIGSQMHEQVLPTLSGINTNNFFAAFKAVMDNDTANMKMQPMEAQQAFVSIMNKLADAKAAANLKKGEEFLAENAKKDGVVSLPSGIQYIVLEEGKGEKPTVEDQVECDYVGTLIDGTEFDSSIKRGQPATFPLRGVIKGWQEVIPMMSVGSKWKIFIPAAYAYGAQDRPGIPGNSLLIFEVTLHQIIKAEKPETKNGNKK